MLYTHHYGNIYVREEVFMFLHKERNIRESHRDEFFWVVL